MREIPLTRGLVALVDDESYDELAGYRWRPKTNGHTSVLYAIRTTEPGRTAMMHREILKAPNGMQVDHVDGNGLNNQRANLRLATNQQNAFNRPPRTPGYKGVTRQRSGRWQARITIGGKRICIGTYDTDLEAARAYDEAALFYFGEFARTNAQIRRLTVSLPERHELRSLLHSSLPVS